MKRPSTLKVHALASLILAVPLLAADLIVEENGVLPNYGTIQNAVNAAMPGDRIFVQNKAGNIPYQESVSINKPIEVLPFVANGQFHVFGTYTISANPANFSPQSNTVRIVGMFNSSGSINATSNNSTGNSVRIDLHGNQLTAGSINMTGTGFVSHVSGNWLLAGSITTREATITGNLVNGNITINDAAGQGTAGVDTLYVVGNRLTTNTGGPIAGRINWTNNDHYCHIANNWVRSNNTSGLISASSLRLDGGLNQIVNNSCEGVTGSSQEGIAVTVILTVGGRLKIENNVLHNEGGTGTHTGISLGTVYNGALVEANFNVFEGWTTDFVSAAVSQTGNTSASASMDPDNVTGVCSDASCVNAGHPGTDYTDHDLTRNDRGVAGGSYNHNNFWPILTGGARVYLVKTPRTVLQSSTIDAEADAHDR